MNTRRVALDLIEIELTTYSDDDFQNSAIKGVEAGNLLVALDGLSHTLLVIELAGIAASFIRQAGDNSLFDADEILRQLRSKP